MGSSPIRRSYFALSRGVNKPAPRRWVSGHEHMGGRAAGPPCPWTLVAPGELLEGGGPAVDTLRWPVLETRHRVAIPAAGGSTSWTDESTSACLWCVATAPASRGSTFPATCRSCSLSA